MENSSVEVLAMKKIMILFLGILLVALMGFSLISTASISGDVEPIEMSDDVNVAP
jgi:hypothetical protein